MSQSIYLTIYFRNTFDENKFKENMEAARRINKNFIYNTSYYNIK